MMALLNATEALMPVFEYLATHSSINIKNYCFKDLGKILFRGIIYNNLMIQECLNEIDRKLQYPIKLTSPGDSSEEDEHTPIPEIEYDSARLHNQMRLSDGAKAQFAMFVMQTKTVQFTNFQLTNRKPLNKSDYKQFSTDPKADIYGERYPNPKQGNYSHKIFEKLFREDSYAPNKRQFPGFGNFGQFSFNKSDESSSDEFSDKENELDSDTINYNYFNPDEIEM